MMIKGYLVIQAPSKDGKRQENDAENGYDPAAANCDDSSHREYGSTLCDADVT
jgi:hypothetical protein